MESNREIAARIAELYLGGFSEEIAFAAHLEAVLDAKDARAPYVIDATGWAEAAFPRPEDAYAPWRNSKAGLQQNYLHSLMTGAQQSKGASLGHQPYAGFK